MLMTLKTARLWSAVLAVVLVAGAVSAMAPHDAARPVWSLSAAL